jgi:AraC-like DNA-binding protein
MPLSRQGENAVRVIQRQLLNSHEIRLMLKELEAVQGGSTRAILAGTGVSPGVLADPGQRLTLVQELEIYTRIAHRNRDPLLGIRVGRRLSLSSYGILGYAVMGTKTLNEALEMVTEFSPLISWASHHSLTYENYRGVPCRCLTLFPTADDALAAALEIESTIASLQSVFNELAGETVAFAGIEMAHSNRAVTGEEFRRVFRCPVVCDSERNALLLPQKLLAMHLPYPQPEYSALFRDMCRQSMASLQEERGLVEAIRELIVAREGSVPTLEQVAAHFSLSARTLRRHLQAIGTSYRALLEGERHASACRYLSSTGLTVSAIAGQLGYADARSFRTAFRRWKGTTPAAYRLQAGATGSVVGASGRILHEPGDKI